MKTVTIPFDLELAKKIQNGEVEGRIVNGEGTEYEIVKWDAKGDYPLIGVYFNKSIDTTMARSFNEQGTYNKVMGTVLDLQLEVPEYLTWKEGDYLTIHYDGYPHTYIFIYKSFTANVSNPIKYHALFNVENNCLKIESETISEGDILPSTPSEIELMHELLLENGKRWNPETKRVEDVKKEPEHELKPLDLILVRCNCWELCQYAFVKDGYVHTVGSLAFSEWIPYKGNEHLLGTTNNPEEHED
jgi:hypothetical protein